MDSLDAWLRDAARRLTQTLALNAGEARLEARILLGRALGVERVWLVAHGGDVLPATGCAVAEALLARRLQGEPVAYLLGEREFYGRPFAVSPAVLIPRPETELLVDAALARLPENGRALDLGTGSGCLALTLALERPDCAVTAVDQSPQALAVARGNGQHLGARHVQWLEGDWFAPLAAHQRFHVIVSNPPYIEADDPHLAQGDVRFEPRHALAAGADGLDDLRRLIAVAPAHLEPGGWLLLEHGWNQGEACRTRLTQAGFGDAQTLRDLAGLERVSLGQWPPSTRASG